MARALEPGTARRADEAAKESAAVRRVTVVRLVREDKVYRLAAANLPLDQRTAVLRQVGVAFDAVVASGDVMLAVAVMVWMARRNSGERSLSWAQFQRHWPDDLTDDDIDLWAENVQGQRIDEDGNVIPDPDAAFDVVEVDERDLDPQS